MNIDEKLLEKEKGDTSTLGAHGWDRSSSHGRESLHSVNKPSEYALLNDCAHGSSAVSHKPSCIHTQKTVRVSLQRLPTLHVGGDLQSAGHCKGALPSHLEQQHLKECIPWPHITKLYLQHEKTPASTVGSVSHLVCLLPCTFMKPFSLAQISFCANNNNQGNVNINLDLCWRLVMFSVIGSVFLSGTDQPKQMPISKGPHLIWFMIMQIMQCYQV